MTSCEDEDDLRVFVSLYLLCVLIVKLNYHPLQAIINYINHDVRVCAVYDKGVSAAIVL